MHNGEKNRGPWTTKWKANHWETINENKRMKMPGLLRWAPYSDLHILFQSHIPYTYLQEYSQGTINYKTALTSHGLLCRILNAVFCLNSSRLFLPNGSLLTLQDSVQPWASCLNWEPPTLWILFLTLSHYVRLLICKYNTCGRSTF